jgi:dTDP-L-rhamnose 4-epimerase
MVVYGEGRYRCPEHGEVNPGPRLVEDLEAGRYEARCAVCAGPLTPEAISEAARPDPRNVYAATKLQQEHLCAAFARESGATVISLRYHNVYGPRMPRDTPYAGVASIFASSLSAGDAPRVFEDGAQLRDFVHVRDVARANVQALCAGDVTPGVFNVASGQPRSILEMAQALADAHGDRAPRPMVTGQYRLGDVRHVFASVEKARKDLGFAAEEEFTAGMAEFSRAAWRSAA